RREAKARERAGRPGRATAAATPARRAGTVRPLHLRPRGAQATARRHRPPGSRAARQARTRVARPTAGPTPTRAARARARLTPRPAPAPTPAPTSTPAPTPTPRLTATRASTAISPGRRPWRPRAITRKPGKATPTPAVTLQAARPATATTGSSRTAGTTKM